MSRANNVLFYSSHCPFSKEVIDLITKRDIKEYFLMVCVDQLKNRRLMPREIDRVPALLVRDENRILFDDAIIQFIGQPDADDIMPVEQVTSAFSENFSFLGDESTDTVPTASKNFALFGQEQHIHTPEDDNSSGKGDTGNVMERYMSQRAKDVTNIFGDKKIVS